MSCSKQDNFCPSALNKMIIFFWAVVAYFTVFCQPMTFNHPSIAYVDGEPEIAAGEFPGMDS